MLSFTYGGSNIEFVCFSFFLGVHFLTRNEVLVSIESVIFPLSLVPSPSRMPLCSVIAFSLITLIVY